MTEFCGRGCPSSIDCEIANQLMVQAANLKNGNLPITSETASAFANRAEGTMKAECRAQEMAEPALDYYRNAAKSL